MTERGSLVARLEGAMQRLNENLASFDAEVASELMSEGERADLWGDIDVNVEDLRVVLAAAALSRPEQVVAVPPLTEAMIRGACKGFYKTENIDGVSMTFKGIDHTFRAAFKKMWKGAFSTSLTTAPAPEAPLPVADKGGVTEEPHRQRFKSGIRAAIAWLHHRARFDMNDPHAKAILNTAAYHLGNALSRNCIKPENSAALPSLSRIRTDAGRDILETLKEAIDATPPSTLLAMLTGAYQEIDALRAALSTTTAAPLQADELSDEDRNTYWKDAYERMAARNIDQANKLKTAVTALDDLANGRGLFKPIEQIIQDVRLEALPPATAEERAASKEGA